MYQLSQQTPGYDKLFDLRGPFIDLNDFGITIKPLNLIFGEIAVSFCSIVRSKSIPDPLQLKCA